MEEFDQSIQIVREMKQIMDAVKTNIRGQCGDMALTGPQIMLIGILHHHGPLKVGELSRHMALSYSTVSGIVDRLEKSGFAERIRGEKDGRVVIVRLTAKAEDMVDRHFGRIEAAIRDKMSAASPDDSDKILEGLRVLKRLL